MARCSRPATGSQAVDKSSADACQPQPAYESPGFDPGRTDLLSNGGAEKAGNDKQGEKMLTPQTILFRKMDRGTQSYSRDTTIAKQTHRDVHTSHALTSHENLSSRLAIQVIGRLSSADCTMVDPDPCAQPQWQPTQTTIRGMTPTCDWTAG